MTCNILTMNDVFGVGIFPSVRFIKLVKLLSCLCVTTGIGPSGNGVASTIASALLATATSCDAAAVRSSSSIHSIVCTLFSLDSYDLAAVSELSSS